MKQTAIARRRQYVKDCLTLISEYFPGNTTLNQIRIAQYIGMRSVGGKGHTSHSEICRDLGMSASTVTRAVAGFIESGLLKEEVDPADSRRRQVTLNACRHTRALPERIQELARSHFSRPAPDSGDD